MKNYRDFTLQSSQRDEEGKLARPDLIGRACAGSRRAWLARCLLALACSPCMGCLVATRQRMTAAVKCHVTKTIDSPSLIRSVRAAESNGVDTSLERALLHERECSARPLTHEEERRAICRLTSRAVEILTPRSIAAASGFYGLGFGIGEGALAGGKPARHVINDPPGTIHLVPLTEADPSVRPATFLEVHYFFMPSDPDVGTQIGFGPYVSLRVDEDASFGGGVMFGIRQYPSSPFSIDLGIGLYLDPDVRVRKFEVSSDAEREDVVRAMFVVSIGWGIRKILR